MHPMQEASVMPEAWLKSSSVYINSYSFSKLYPEMATMLCMYAVLEYFKFISSKTKGISRKSIILLNVHH